MDGSSDATRRDRPSGVRGFTRSELPRSLLTLAVAMLLLAAGAGSAAGEVTGAGDNQRTGW